MYLREGIRKQIVVLYLSAIEHVVDHAVGQLDTKSQFLLKKRAKWTDLY